MPGENVQDWSTTAASNGTADSLINWAEGQTRASVNNSARGMMAAIAKVRNLTNGSITTTGTANAQAFASGVTYTSVPTNLSVLLKIGAGLTNNGPMTLNMDGIGNVAVTTSDGAALIGGEVRGAAYNRFVYNGSNWVLEASASREKSAAKAWCFASTTGIIAASYNVSSVTDAGIGFIIFNFIAPLSANHVALAIGAFAPGGTAASTLVTQIQSITANADAVIAVNLSTFSQTDPTNWHFVAYGD